MKSELTRTLRRHYPGWRDKIIRLYDMILRRFPKAPLPGRKRVCKVQFRGLDEKVSGAFFVRLGSSDFVVLEQLYVGQEYGELFKRDLGEMRLILDLGANIGGTLRLWHAHYPAARVIAIEPDESNFHLAQRNAETEGTDWFSLVHGCIAAKSGTVYLNRTKLEWAYEMSHENRGGAPLPALTVPELLARGETQGTIDLLKCDIEGAESEVFADCANWIGNVRNLVIELHKPYFREQLLADLKASGHPFAACYHLDSGDGYQVLLLTRGGHSGHA